MPRRIGAEIRAALGLLTRIPVGAQPPDTGGAAAFGFVGALVGALGSVAIVLVGGQSPLAAGGIALALMALVSGGLHIDGLADTFDALAAPSREAAEHARTDPRTGAAGAAAIAIVIVVDAALLAALAAEAGMLMAALACVTAASASRAVAVALSVVGPRTTYAGSGSWFASRTGPASVVVSGVSAGLIALVGSIVAGTPVLLLGAVVGSVAALLASMWLARLRDVVDGDLLGAAIEIAFALLLVAIVLAT